MIFKIKKHFTLLLIILIFIPNFILAYTDNDGDGFYADSPYPNKVDCVDIDIAGTLGSNIHPDVVGEVFNGFDDDCDGEVDEGLYWKQSKANKETSNSVCFINKTNPNFFLQCDIESTSNYIIVYQNISHLKPGDYIFSYDSISGDPEVIININSDDTNLCDPYDNGCELNNLIEIHNLNIILKFTADAKIDNITLLLVNDEINQLEKIRPDIANEPFMSQPRPASCCPNDYCWNGTGCVDSNAYMQDTTKEPIVMDSIKNGYRCIKERDADGVIHNVSDWKYSKLKNDPFNYQKGYCPYEDMCLVSINLTHDNFNDQPPYYGCAKPGEFVSGMNLEDTTILPNFFYNDTKYFKDFYCDEGNWTSRTKFLAMSLLEIGEESGESFLIFCDKAEKETGTELFSSLNYYMNQEVNELYSIEPGIFDSDITEHLFNNFCVLIINSSPEQYTGEVFDINDQVFIGATLDARLTDSLPGTYTEQTIGGEPPNPDAPAPPVHFIFPNLFRDINGDIDQNANCQQAEMQEIGYTECTENFYYNNATWSFIYSTQSMSEFKDELETNEGFLDKLIDFFPNLFENIVDIFRSITNENTAYRIDATYLDSQDTFQKLYFAKIGDIQVEGINQRKMNIFKEMTDYAYFKYINYPICKETAPDTYNLDINPKSYLWIVKKATNKNITCEYNTTNNAFSFVIEGDLPPPSEHRIDEVWYDLTGKLRPLN